MNEENFKQQELFEQKKYISDLVEESTNKKKSSLKVGPRGQGGIYNPRTQLDLYKKGIKIFPFDIKSLSKKGKKG